MGYGDSLMALGDAWVTYTEDPTRRKVAIGDGRTVDKNIDTFRYGLEHLLATQDEADKGNVSWVRNYPGHRPYHKHAETAATKGARWVFDESYRPTPAPICFKPEELAIIDEWQRKGPFIVVEPYIKEKAPPSKQFPLTRFKRIVDELKKDYAVYQISRPDLPTICDLPRIPANSFRETLAYLRASSLYIGPEGGLHHGAAAVGTKAIVLFGGYISPTVTGYDFHTNLTGGSIFACGTRKGVCQHCIDSFNNILPEDVVRCARAHMTCSYAL